MVDAEVVDTVKKHVLVLLVIFLFVLVVVLVAQTPAGVITKVEHSLSIVPAALQFLLT